MDFKFLAPFLVLGASPTYHFNVINCRYASHIQVDTNDRGAYGIIKFDKVKILFLRNLDNL